MADISLNLKGVVFIARQFGEETDPFLNKIGFLSVAFKTGTVKLLMLLRQIAKAAWLFKRTHFLRDVIGQLLVQLYHTGICLIQSTDFFMRQENTRHESKDDCEKR